MSRTTATRRRDALAIWHAALDAVRADRLVIEQLRVDGNHLLLAAAEPIPLDSLDRIVVIGAGKAGAAMAAGTEQALGPELLDRFQVDGWVQVPESSPSDGSAAPPIPQRIRLYPARPAGVNEPTEQGVRGCHRMLRRVAELGPRDLCLCLLSGGGSALLPAPIEGISLEDKLAITRHLSASGASIEQLNTVRKQLSRVKGGGLARACRAGRLVSLIISDVLGDPLDLIASGPTVTDRSTPGEALSILEQFDAASAGIAPRVFNVLREKARRGSKLGENFVGFSPKSGHQEAAVVVENHIIGNIATAVDAAGLVAERLGYSHAMLCARHSEGPAEDVGRHLADTALHMRRTPGPDCLISGGEPVVRLVAKERRGLGGRNQQLALAAMEHLGETIRGITLLSGGTDGEDGPTDAAGAIVDDEVAKAASSRRLSAMDYLTRNDAYHFFRPLGALLHTGPTGTNVCDVRVVLVDRIESR